LFCVNEPRKARVFYALVPDRALQGALGALGRDLAERTAGRVLPDENIHLTLAFLGDVAVTGLDALKALLAALPARAFALELDTLGGFRHADVAWIAPSNAPQALAELCAVLGAELRNRGFVLDARPFRPHLTLVRRCRRPPATASCAPLRWQVTALSLLASEAAQRGVRYRELARRDFPP
jgi:2'-5' RNA ligase